MRVTDARRERGAVAVMIAIMALLLIICIAFAVDLGYAWQVRRSMVKATDAAALAAAHEARDRSRSGAVSLPLLNDCSAVPPVGEVADEALTSNRVDARMDFCTIANNSGTSNGVVTVRGSTDAALSFSGVIGKQSIGVHSATSVAWTQPRFLPLAVCADAVGNNDLAKWVQNPISPTGDVDLRVSASESSRLCSSGGSGYWGAVDLGKNVSGYSAFGECRDYGSFENTWLDVFNGKYGTVQPRVGQYFCGAVGTPSEFDYTKRVDAALCSLPKGTEVALPIVAEPPNSTTGGGSGKQWIVKIGGYVTATFDGYSGILSQTDLCAQFPKPAGVSARKPGHPGRGTHLRRHPRFQLARAGVRRSAPINGRANVSDLSPLSTTVVAGTNVTFTATVTNYSLLFLPSPQIEVTLPAGATMVSGCAKSGSVYTCSAGSPAPSGSDVTISFTASFTASGQVTAGLLCSGLDSSGKGNPCDTYVVKTPAAATVTVPSRTGNKIVTLAIDPTGTGSGTVRSDDGRFACTNGGPCPTQNYESNDVVTFRAAPAPGSYFAGWVVKPRTGTYKTPPCADPLKPCAITAKDEPTVTAKFNRSLTLSLNIGGTGAGRVTSSDNRVDCSAPCQVTYQTPTTITLTATESKNSSFGGWSGACQGLNPTCTVTLGGSTDPSVTATFNSGSSNTQKDFRQLTLNFTGVFRTPGFLINDVISYRICAVDVKTSAEAKFACPKP